MEAALWQRKAGMLSTVIIAQSGKVKTGISRLKQAQDIEAKLNGLDDSINSLNSKLTGVAALSWVVSKQTKPKKGRYRR